MPASATGSDYLRQIASLDLPSRSLLAVQMAQSGNYPSWFGRRWMPVTASITNGDQKHTLTYYVAPDYFSVGTDSDFVIPELLEGDAQSIANAFHSILPTRRMVLAIYQAANRKLPLSDVKKPPESIPSTQIESAAAVAAAKNIDMRASYDPRTDLVAGHRKDYVIGPNLDGSHLAIYGGGGGPVDGVFIQSYPSPHGSFYSDYSHGLRLVSRNAVLDGSPVDLANVFIDPTLANLVSDQGAFVPSFPNVKNGKAFSAFSMPAPLPPSATKPNAPTTSKDDFSAVGAVLIVGGALALVFGGRMS